MVRWIVLSYPSKKCVGAEYRRYLGEMLMAYFVAGGQDSGGDGAYSWFDQWWCNQCFIFCCVGICADDGDGDGWGTM